MDSTVVGCSPLSTKCYSWGVPVHPLRSSQCAFASAPVVPLSNCWDEMRITRFGVGKGFVFHTCLPQALTLTLSLLNSGVGSSWNGFSPKMKPPEAKRGCWLPADVNERKFHEYLYYFGWRAPVISWLSLFSFLISWSLQTIYHHPPAVGGWDEFRNSGEDSSEQRQVRPERKLIYIFNVLTGEKNVRRHYHGLTIENPSLG